MSFSGNCLDDISFFNFLLTPRALGLKKLPSCLFTQLLKKRIGSCINVLTWHYLAFSYFECKVLSFLEACFDLISGSSLSMKIQIMGGKITENLGFKSPLRKVKKNFVLFSFHSYLTKRLCVSKIICFIYSHL